jgi:hypothetical protein
MTQNESRKVPNQFRDSFSQYYKRDKKKLTSDRFFLNYLPFGEHIKKAIIKTLGIQAYLI